MHRSGSHFGIAVGMAADTVVDILVDILADMVVRTAASAAGNIAADTVSDTVLSVVASIAVAAECIAVKDTQDAAASIVGDTEVKNYRPAADHTASMAENFAEDMLDLEGIVPEMHFGYVVVASMFVGFYIADKV
ncbi:hypothetical protein N7540_000423 [Penicillium herquei]|nr:hypothetical protein N7540_000423 [Penicillium herquei]